MIVTFLKDHLEWREGQSIDVDEDLATYWINCGVAILAADIDEVTQETIEKTLSKKLKSAKKKK
jgi:hypothetical protein